MVCVCAFENVLAHIARADDADGDVFKPRDGRDALDASRGAHVDAVAPASLRDG